MSDLSDTGSTIDFRIAESDSKEVAEGFDGEAVQRIFVAELSIQVLIEQTKLRRFWQPGYDEAARLLQTLPLTTAKFDLANRHLLNANRYSRDGEFGAASFELRMLRGCVQRL
jgi:hypothetical protein